MSVGPQPNPNDQRARGHQKLESRVASDRDVLPVLSCNGSKRGVGGIGTDHAGAEQGRQGYTELSEGSASLRGDPASDEKRTQDDDGEIAEVVSESFAQRLEHITAASPGEKRDQNRSQQHCDRERNGKAAP